MVNMDGKQDINAVIAAYVKRVVAEYADHLVSITLYGSQARGDALPESDIDLFVVTKNDVPGLEDALSHIAWEIQFEYDVVIADVIRTLSETEQLQHERSPYFQNLEREGIVLWMNPSVSTSDYVGSVPLKN